MPSITYSVDYNGFTNTIDVSYDSNTAAVTNAPSLSGHAYLSISGSWGGNAITAMYGDGGSQQSTPFESVGITYNNTYFDTISDGDGGSLNGVDQDGLVFTVNSIRVSIYYDGAGGHQLAYDDGSDHFASVTLSVACFRAGTRIRTTRGEIAIEDLLVGDAVVLAAGSFGRVKWTGHRSVEIARHPRPWDVMPIRVQAHAFAENQPVRDLVLSPDHAVHVDGVLIPIRYLLNGASIRQEAAERVTWWHVELERHAVILAEGLPAESYLDTGNRGAFEGNGALQMHADFAREAWQAKGCAELVTAGPKVIAARRALMARLDRLGHSISTDADLRLLAGNMMLQPVVIGDCWRVVMPAGASALRLCSRTLVPADLFPENDDRRCLGVAVVELRIDGEAVALDDDRLTGGWQAAETGLRWTDGQGVLAAPAGSVVELRVAPLGQYRVVDEREVRLAA